MVRRRDQPVEGADRVLTFDDRHQALEGADLVVLALALNAENRHFIAG